MSDSDNFIIIDADPGVDDALAILMALSRQSRHLANVLAITTVPGNAEIDQICLNVRLLVGVSCCFDQMHFKMCRLLCRFSFTR